MQNRIITITANRNLAPEDNSIIADKMTSLVEDLRTAEIVFGGARGGDSAALYVAYTAREAFRFKTPKLTVVVPDVLSKQPIETHEISKLADELIELNKPITSDDGFDAYRYRNHYMIDKSTTHVVAFWNGSKRSGTWKTIQYAQYKQLPIEIVNIHGDD